MYQEQEKLAFNSINILLHLFQVDHQTAKEQVIYMIHHPETNKEER